MARLLNEMGHRTRKGARFSDTTVDRLLRDPTAKGLRRANYTKSLGDKKQWKLKPEHEWVYSKVEAVVTEELWDQVNAILEAQRKDGKPPAKKTVHLFAGITFCTCGKKMYVPVNSPKYTCNKCRKKIPIEDLEGVFHEQLKSFFFSPAEIAEYLEQADTTIKDKGKLLQTLERRRKKLTLEMDKVYRLHTEDQLSADGFGRQYRPLEEQLKQLEDQIPGLQGEVDYLKIQYLSSDEILAEARDLYSRWPALTVEEKRQIVENITDRITIGDDDVTIDLCYLPSSSQVMTKGQHNPTGSWRQPT